MVKSMGPQSKTLKFIADRTLNSPHSAFLGKVSRALSVHETILLTSFFSNPLVSWLLNPSRAEYLVRLPRTSDLTPNTYWINTAPKLCPSGCDNNSPLRSLIRLCGKSKILYRVIHAVLIFVAVVMLIRACWRHVSELWICSELPPKLQPLCTMPSRWKFGVVPPTMCAIDFWARTLGNVCACWESSTSWRIISFLG